MPLTSGFKQLSLPLLSIGVAALILLVSHFAWKGGAGMRRRKAHLFDDAVTDFAASSILGLLALLLAFTFSLAAGRYEARRALTVEEANAIGTTFLRTRLLRDPAGAELRVLLKAYLDARIRQFDAEEAMTGDPAPREEITALEGRIWDATARMIRAERGAIESIFVNSLNEMIDLENKRSVAFLFTLPDVLYWFILLIACFGIAAFSLGRGVRNSPQLAATAPLALMIGLVFALIHDFDRPGSGFIRVGQSAMISLRQSMDR